MIVEVTKENVVITQGSVINSDEIGVNRCEFILPSCFEGLSVTAVFNGIPVPLVDCECWIPSLEKGNAVLGVYAYKEVDGEVELMYSPKPTMFFVSQGSFCEQINESAVAQISLYEQYCKMLAEKYEEAELTRSEAEILRATAEYLRSQAETERVSAEEARKADEQVRVSNEQARQSAELARSEAFDGVINENGSIVVGTDNIQDRAVTVDKVSQYFFRDGVSCAVGDDIALHMTQKVPDNKVYLSAELTSKTDEITEESTNEIPTAKAVVDYVNAVIGGIENGSY